MITTRKLEKKFLEMLGGEEKAAAVLDFYVKAGHPMDKIRELMLSRLPPNDRFRLYQLNGQTSDRERGDWLVQYPGLLEREQMRKEAVSLGKEAIAEYIDMMRPYRKQKKEMTNGK